MSRHPLGWCGRSGIAGRGVPKSGKVRGPEPGNELRNRVAAGHWRGISPRFRRERLRSVGRRPGDAGGDRRWRRRRINAPPDHVRRQDRRRRKPHAVRGRPLRDGRCRGVHSGRPVPHYCRHARRPLRAAGAGRDGSARIHIGISIRGDCRRQDARGHRLNPAGDHRGLLFNRAG